MASTTATTLRASPAFHSASHLPDQHFHPHIHSGNNVITYVGAQQFTTVQSSATLNFNYVQDPTVNPDAVQANIDAARVNTFYIVNTVHDISYQYGFNEAAFNFQNNNFGKGGAGNDRVEVSVQDASGKNNGEPELPGPLQKGIRGLTMSTLQRSSAPRPSRCIRTCRSGGND